MAPNPKVGKAFRAMAVLGFEVDAVRPVLKRLLKLYDKDFTLIEEDNYRALAEAVLDSMENTVAQEPEKKKEKTVDVGNLEEEGQDEEPQRPLKRLRPQRLRDQEGLVSPSSTNHSPQTNGNFPKQPKLEQEDTPSESPIQALANKRNAQVSAVSPQEPATSTGSQPSSAQGNSSQEPVTDGTVPSEQCSSHDLLVTKGKEPISSQVYVRGKRPHAATELAIRIDQPPKRMDADSYSLIVPKDEPFIDEMPLNEPPLAIMRPDSSNGNFTVRDIITENQAGPEGRVYGDDNALVTSRNPRVRVDAGSNTNEPSSNLEIASSPSGEGRVINETQSDDPLKKSSASNALCVWDTAGTSDSPSDSPSQTVRPVLHVPKLANNFGEHGILNGSLENFSGTRLVDPESCSLTVAPQCQLANNELRSLHDLNDITKAEEAVEIPWFNEVNNEFPPSFHYIPGNLVFQHASVKFTLSQITADNCCTSCIGDCLSSSNPCVCVAETLYGYAYTPEGLLKDDFLQECISMTQDPQSQYLSYCTNCPLERSTNEEMIDTCKGHLNRKFIKECWRKCGCHKNCGNRVVQRGIKRKLQVFFTSDGKGWGLRTLEKLPKGAFVCEYIGEILTIREWHQRTIEISRSAKTETPTSVKLDAYWNSRGALKDEEFLCLDATYYGNVARFINHRCRDANLIEIPVKIDTPAHHYYHLAFFTTREVDALEELTWDYGIEFDDNDQSLKRFECKCGSKFCRNMKRPSRSRLLVR
ncbi:Probable inactive histone-lysine N-methyltransferase SUVR2 [Linum perenne]